MALATLDRRPPSLFRQGPTALSKLAVCAAAAIALMVADARFGLTPEQLDRLDPSKREKVQKAVAQVGTLLVGKFITQDLVLRAAKLVGVRLTAKQAARFRHALDALEHVMKSSNQEALEDLIRTASDARANWQMNGPRR